LFVFCEERDDEDDEIEVEDNYGTSDCPDHWSYGLGGRL
jgi:hypothetical protein